MSEARALLESLAIEKGSKVVIKDGCALLNGLDGVLSHRSAQNFIKLLHVELKAGRGFIPFVGAGLSAPSGVPLVRELEPYLHRCLGMALGVADDPLRPWNPRSDQWPPFSPTTFQDHRRWHHLISEQLERAAEADSSNRNTPVLQEGLGALAEWRTSLQFLSRLVHEESDDEGKKRVAFILGEPRQEIVDACLRAVLSGRHPTLGHRMLAALGGLLRLDVILTTNFDELLEQAFADARNPLTVFDVHLGDRLPAWSAVSTQRSLVKLHGTLYSLRADYSLDGTATYEDRERFAEYVQGAESSPVRDAHPVEVKSQLLVLGASAAERRTKSFIMDCWERFGESFLVYWVCHSTDCVKHVTGLSRKYFRKNGKTGSVVLRHTNPGLLFLQLFQSVRHTIPAGGVLFPSASRLPLPPLGGLNSSYNGPYSRKAYRKRVISTLVEMIKSQEQALPRLLVTTSPNGLFGVTSLCADAFEALETKALCIWLDLNDVFSTDDMFEQLLDAMYHRLGSESWLPVFVARDTPSQADEIRRLAQMTARPWILFLNARETPGSNGLHFEVEAGQPNGWLDHLTPKETSACTSSFVSFLSQLCPSDAGEPIVSVVLLCRQAPDTDAPVIRELNRMNLKQRYLDLSEFPSDSDAGSRSDGPEGEVQDQDDTESIAKKCLAWVEETDEASSADERRQFLHRLVLMQRTRFICSVSQQPLSDDSFQEQWISRLEDLGLVRRQLGGFIWLHAAVRNLLRQAMTSESAIEHATLHWDLAIWYHRVLCSSASPYALFEAVYHACRSAEAHIRMPNGTGLAIAAQHIEWATDSLRSNSFLVQTLGYSRGSCRRLLFVRQDLCRSCADAMANLGDERENNLRNKLCGLVTVCTEIMRTIAREVGEVEKAYERHRELRALLALNDVDQKDVLQRPALADAILANPQKDSPESVVEWIRWHKWCGMLGIASRQFSEARRALIQGLWSATQSDSPGSGLALIDMFESPHLLGLDDKEIDSVALTALRGIAGAGRNANQSILGFKCDGTGATRLRIEILRIAEQFIACRLHEHSVEKRRSDGLTVNLDLVERTAIQAGDIANCGMVGSVKGRASSMITWCKSRLFLHRGHNATFRGDFSRAMQFYNDAEAALNLGDLGRFESDRAIVELYRAETRMAEALSTSIAASAFPPTIDRFIQECLNDFRTSPQNIAILRRLVSYDDTPLIQTAALQSSLRRANALVRDAISFLDRAERIFARRRRNTAWTTWYLDRRVKAISLAIWTSLLDRARPIPFLGIEASPESEDTIADGLVKQSLRLIRNDAYRLATIVEGYTSCAVALRFRLLTNRRGPRLQHRQSNMLKRLGEAMHSLSRVLDNRKRPPEATMFNRSRDLDVRVDRYIEEKVLQDCNVASNALRYNCG